MGYDTIAVNHVTPPFYQMTQQGLIEKKRFGVWMSHAAEQGEGGGEIVFGGSNPDRYVADTLRWAPVTRKAYWEVELRNATLGGVALPLGAVDGKPMGAAIDTGSNHILYNY